MEQIIQEIKNTVEPLMARWVQDKHAKILELKELQQTLHQNADYLDSKQKALDTVIALGCDSLQISVIKNCYKYTYLEGLGFNQSDRILAQYHADDILKRLQKEADNKLKKIGTAVRKKINFEVNDIEKMFFREGVDGFFEGGWLLNGNTVFRFETFYAGGYNIQCRHVRTKYTLKEKKCATSARCDVSE